MRTMRTHTWPASAIRTGHHVHRADGVLTRVRGAHRYTGAMSGQRLVRLDFGSGIVERRAADSTVLVGVTK